MRRLLIVVFGFLAVVPMSAARAADPVPVVVVDGKGFGHGVGMAQDGALAMGRAGAKVEQILAHFYRGTAIGRATGDVRVVVSDAVNPGPAAVEVTFPDGGTIQQDGEQSSGFPIDVPAGGQVRIVWDGGRYVVERQFTVALAAYQVPVESTTTTSSTSTTSTTLMGTTTTTTSTTSTSTTTTTTTLLPSSTTTTTAPPSNESTTTTSTTGAGEQRQAVEEASSTRPLWLAPANGSAIELRSRQRRYRGLLHVTAEIGRLRVLNQLNVETYLKGMGEVRDPSWPLASLKAQAIAARTYALRAMGVGGELCDSQRCQVYLGATAEYAAMNKAVNESAGQVVVYRRTLASAVYSANGGGYSASVEEGFGSTFGADYPYLQPATYPTVDPAPWSVTVALRDVAARLRYPGDLTAVSVSRTGPSGRALEVLLDGTAGPRPVRGIDFDAALGLRSTLFSLRLDVAEAPGPLAPAEALPQAPPELAATVTAEPVETADEAVPSAMVERASRSRSRAIARPPQLQTVSSAPYLAAGLALAFVGFTLTAMTVRRLVVLR